MSVWVKINIWERWKRGFNDRWYRAKRLTIFPFGVLFWPIIPTIDTHKEERRDMHKSSITTTSCLIWSWFYRILWSDSPPSQGPSNEHVLEPVGMVLESIQRFKRWSTRAFITSSCRVWVEVPDHSHWPQVEQSACCMPVEVLDGVENPILVIHQPIQCIAGAVGLGMRESFLELGGFVAQLEYLIFYTRLSSFLRRKNISTWFNKIYKIFLLFNKLNNISMLLKNLIIEFYCHIRYSSATWCDSWL